MNDVLLYLLLSLIIFLPIVLTDLTIEHMNIQSKHVGIHEYLGYFDKQ